MRGLIAGSEGQAKQSTTEQLTVVVMQLVGGPALDACLQALSSQESNVMVARREGPTEHASMPMRRLSALNSADSDIVAFIEDTCVPGPTWCAAIRRAFADTDVVAAGGPVEISRNLPARARALGICEYARFQAQQQRVNQNQISVDRLAGANFAVRKSAMPVEASPADMIDTQMFQHLNARGRVSMECGAGVVYAADDHQGARLATRFHHGRIYGGGQTSGQGFLNRLVRSVRTLAVPAVLIFRSVRDAPGWVWRSPGVLAWILMMHSCWSAGELVGVFTGRIGNSLKEWT